VVVALRVLRGLAAQVVAVVRVTLLQMERQTQVAVVVVHRAMWLQRRVMVVVGWLLCVMYIHQ